MIFQRSLPRNTSLRNEKFSAVNALAVHCAPLRNGRRSKNSAASTIETKLRHRNPYFSGFSLCAMTRFFIAHSLRKLFCAIMSMRLGESHCANERAMRFPVTAHSLRICAPVPSPSGKGMTGSNRCC
jgi:hypothetical protein